MSEELNIPQGWAVDKFGDACIFSQGIQVDVNLQSDVKKDKQVRFLRIVDFTQGDEPPRYIDHPGERYFINKDDIAMVRYGTVGFVCTGKEGVIANNLFKITPFEYLSKKYLIFFLNSLLFKSKLESKGATMQALSFGLINPIVIPIPPLPEQHRIVAKIEELFSSLDKGIESLKTAQEQLKVYRQAVLKWAFEGKLTNKDVQEGELPEGWRKSKVKSIGKVINGDRGKNYPSRAHYVASGVPFISAGNIEENRIDTKGLNFITEAKYDALNSGKLQNGDLIYCLRGSLGKCAIFNLNTGAISSSLCILRLNSDILNQFVFYYLISPFGRDEILKHDNGTAQPNLSGKSFENFEIVLPTFEEQQNIISEIESRLSVCDKMEESITTSLQQAEALRQSILKKAFEGKLVEQDPNDEPASVLLERIKAEREALQLAQGKNKPVKKVKEKKQVKAKAKL